MKLKEKDSIMISWLLNLTAWFVPGFSVSCATFPLRSFQFEKLSWHHRFNANAT